MITHQRRQRIRLRFGSYLLIILVSGKLALQENELNKSFSRVVSSIESKTCLGAFSGISEEAIEFSVANFKKDLNRFVKEANTGIGDTIRETLAQEKQFSYNKVLDRERAELKTLSKYFDNSMEESDEISESLFELITTSYLTRGDYIDTTLNFNQNSVLEVALKSFFSLPQSRLHSKNCKKVI